MVFFYGGTWNSGEAGRLRLHVAAAPGRARHLDRDSGPSPLPRGQLSGFPGGQRPCRTPGHGARSPITAAIRQRLFRDGTQRGRLQRRHARARCALARPAST
ncbi:hypothetical protein ACU4GD_42595 [Cupriavidus basilensis]